MARDAAHKVSTMTLLIFHANHLTDFRLADKDLKQQLHSGVVKVSELSCQERRRLRPRNQRAQPRTAAGAVDGGAHQNIVYTDAESITPPLTFSPFNHRSSATGCLLRICFHDPMLPVTTCRRSPSLFRSLWPPREQPYIELIVNNSGQCGEKRWKGYSGQDLQNLNDHLAKSCAGGRYCVLSAIPC